MRDYLLHGAMRRYYNETRRAIGHWKNSLTDTGPKLLVLAYHRVLPDAGHDPMRIVVSTKAFAKQIDALVKRYRVVSLGDALKGRGRDFATGEDRVVLTFDDGYWDSYGIVFPILKKKGLSATFFLTTDYVDGKARYLDKRLLDARTGDVRNYIKDRHISWEEARRMSEAGMEMGSHGVTHNSLARMPQKEAEEEILKSRSTVELNTGRPCRYFAFPFGSSSDYNQHLIDYVRKAGFEACFLNIHGYNHFHSGGFCLKRIIMEEKSGTTYLLG